MKRADGVSALLAIAADQQHANSDIVVSNYQRFEKFEIDRYCGIVLDESGILKAQDGDTMRRWQ
jgi:hypothetical protein